MDHSTQPPRTQKALWSFSYLLIYRRTQRYITLECICYQWLHRVVFSTTLWTLGSYLITGLFDRRYFALFFASWYESIPLGRYFVIVHSVGEATVHNVEPLTIFARWQQLRMLDRHCLSIVSQRIRYDMTCSKTLWQEMCIQEINRCIKQYNYWPLFLDQDWNWLSMCFFLYQ